MGLYYRSDYKNNKNRLNQKDSVPVIIDYYYKGKRTKVSTGVVCQIKDWDDNWRKKTSKDPIKSSDKITREYNIPANGQVRITLDEELKKFIGNNSGWITCKSTNPFIDAYYFDFNDSGIMGGDHSF